MKARRSRRQSPKQGSFPVAEGHGRGARSEASPQELSAGSAGREDGPAAVLPAPPDQCSGSRGSNPGATTTSPE